MQIQISKIANIIPGLIRRIEKKKIIKTINSNNNEQIKKTCQCINFNKK